MIKLLLITAFFVICGSHVYASKTELSIDKETIKTLPLVNKIEYKKLPDWPEEMVLKGPATQWQAIVFEGKELVGVMWKSKKGKLQIKEYPYDQITQVVKGILYLTPKGGKMKTHKAGDIFFLEKGFSGIWEMPEEYEEFIVVEKNNFFKYE